MEHKEYNGWTNYETWCVNLWMDNEQGSQAYWSDRAQEYYDNTNSDDTAEDRKNSATYDLANEIKDQHEDFMPELGCSVYSDLMAAALSEVNWYEIASHLIEQVLSEAQSGEPD